jgi:hypothetical protein
VPRWRVPWWVFALVAIGCIALLWFVFTSGGDEPSPSPTASPTATGGGPTAAGPTATGSNGGGSTGAGSDATVAARFPRPAVGERLELRVLSLGDDPQRCEAVGLQLGDEVRTVYHHECAGRPDDISFFLIRMTGRDDQPVTVALDRFELVTEDGETLEPLELADVNKRFPDEVALGPDVSRKGWVLFKLEGHPNSLKYQDELLVVRFPGSWR